MKNFEMKMFILLFAFSVVLSGNSVIDNTVKTESPVIINTKIDQVENVEVALDSFGILGIVLMVGLSSLLGAFFMKDELLGALEK